MTDAAIQLLNPRLQRLRGLALTNADQALGQALQARRQLRIARIEILASRLQEQQGGGHLHRQLGAGRLRAIGEVVRHIGQCIGQGRQGRMQAHQGLAQLQELLAGATQSARVATGQSRPALANRHQALAHLRQQHGVKAPQLLDFIGHRNMAGEAPGLPHSAQERSLHRVGWYGLRAEEGEVLTQALGHRRVALGQLREHHQHPRGGALDVQVGGQQRHAHRLEKARGQSPQAAHRSALRTRRRLRARGQRLAQLRQLARRHRIARLDHPQDRRVHARA